MPICNRCEDKTDYLWYQDHNDRWKLGLQIDTNSYRQHKCLTQEKTGNKRNWSHFTCIRCKSETRQNVKMLKPKELNLCIECDNLC